MDLTLNQNVFQKKDPFFLQSIQDWEIKQCRKYSQFHYNSCFETTYVFRYIRE